MEFFGAQVMCLLYGAARFLQNNKALLSTDVPDGMYYEVTYNGDNKEFYLDAYKKWENISIREGGSVR